MGYSARVLQTNASRQACDDYEQVRVHHRSASVCDAHDTHLIVTSELGAQLCGQLARYIQKLEPFIAPSEWIVVIDRQATEHETILRSQRGEVGAVLRVSQVVWVRL